MKRAYGTDQQATLLFQASSVIYRRDIFLAKTEFLLITMSVLRVKFCYAYNSKSWKSSFWERTCSISKSGSLLWSGSSNRDFAIATVTEPLSNTSSPDLQTLANKLIIYSTDLCFSVSVNNFLKNQVAFENVMLKKYAQPTIHHPHSVWNV